VLAGLEPAWTLTGGAALVGFHTRHRETRDLDLFFRPRRSLDRSVAAVRERLEAAGITVQVIRTTPAFSQLELRDGAESIEVDLVADPTPLAEPPRLIELGDRTILVDTPHQLLVNKLCALLSRSEVRDLVDVQALLADGGDLIRALRDSPEQDAGFSPLTFAWAVRGIPLRRLAGALGFAEPAIAKLEQFREELVDAVLAAAHP
jgi:hypothetical protein